jgi:nucleoside-diphosphate-sugar epimerase
LELTVAFTAAANIDHLDSTKAVVRGLQSRRSSSFLIHTSGAGILTWETRDKDAFGLRIDRVYNDFDGIVEVTSLPAHAPHRDVEQFVLEAHQGHDHLKTAIVCPPIIYGVGRGPGNQHSVQANLIAREVLKNGQGFTMRGSKNVWNYVHVNDLSDLYLLIGEAAIDGGGSASWNKEGYYFTEQGLIEFSKLIDAVSRYAFEQGLLTKKDIVHLEKADVDRLSPDFGVYCGTNSIGTAIRGKKLLGWTQYRPTLLDTVPDVVTREAKQLGLM